MNTLLGRVDNSANEPPPSPPLPRCGLCPAGEGDVSIVNSL